MKDYSQTLNLMHKHIAGRFQQDDTVINVPGTSFACKIDPHYYLAPQPGFEKTVSAWTGLMPGMVRTTLLKTGNLLFAQSEDNHIVTVSVKWTDSMTPVRLRASFILADFIENGLKLYARIRDVPPVTDLKICSKDWKRLEPFFHKKTPLSRVAFADCGTPSKPVP